jgi:hypothetical protein
VKWFVHYDQAPLDTASFLFSGAKMLKLGHLVEGPYDEDEALAAKLRIEQMPGTCNIYVHDSGTPKIGVSDEDSRSR